MTAKKKKPNPISQIILIIIFIIILVLLFHPESIPFLSAETSAAIKAQMQSVFGRLTVNLSMAALFSVVGICIFCWILNTVICMLLKHFSKEENRTRTISELLISLTKFLTFVTAVIWSLSALGVDLGALFASIGILSLIIGFGAQSLIEDTITGIFIIAEGQYNIGDIIIVNDFRGIVRKIGMRTTVIEDDGGNMEIINNSDIRNMQNRSNSLSMAVADVGTPYGMPIEEVEAMIRPELEGMYERNKDIFAEIPTYAGVQSLGESAVVLRFFVRCREDLIFKATRTLNKEVKLCMDKHGIEIPFTQVVVHNSSKE